MARRLILLLTRCLASSIQADCGVGDIVRCHLRPSTSMQLFVFGQVFGEIALATHLHHILLDDVVAARVLTVCQAALGGRGLVKINRPIKTIFVLLNEVWLA